MQKFLLGIAALLAIAVILVGVPIALIIVAGNPIPSGDQLHRIVTLVPDYGNVILLSKVLPCLGWIAWILFAAPLLVEIGAGIAGQRTAKRFLLLKGQQQAAAVLVAAVLVMFAGLGSIHGSAPSAASTHQAPTTTIQFAVPPPTVPPHAPAVEPADITVASVPEPSTETVIHTVVRGDNLWDISERYYGVGTRDMDIFRASTGTVQAGGERLTNPNLILPGWRLTVPDAPAPPTVAAPAPASVPHNIPDSGDAAHDRGTPTGSAPSSLGNATAAPQNSSEATPSRTPKPSQISKPSPVADKAAASPTELAVPLTTAGGLVGLLAAALLVVLGRRRLGQRRRRRPGERIAMPEAATAELEQELRLVANPLGLTDIDNSLRLLQLHAREMGSALPELLAVRLVEEEISLYFMQPADLPAPFEPVTPERTVWTLRPGAIIPPSSATVSPYPALVIIGVDDNDGVLLLDLEQVGVLNILGEESLVLGVLNAVAGELAGNPWGEQIQVTLVGMRSALPQSMDRFRIRHVEHIEDVLAELDGDLQRRGAALRSFGVDNVRAARTLVAETESWAPHIVVLAHSPDETLRRQLADLVASRGRLGVAIVANGSVNNSRATVRVDSSGHAELLLPGNSMPPLPFTPQFLRERELELLQDLIDTTEKDAADPVASEREPVPTPTLDTATTILPASDIPVERRLVDQPDAHDQPRPDGEEDGVPPEILEGMRETAQIAPYLRFLGPVEAEGLGLDEPMPGRGIELMVYLLLRDGPVDGLQLQRAFWPDTPDAANNQRGLAKKVRVALGHNRAGELWLPENINHHGYLLHPDIGSDWDDFRALTGDDPTLASTDNLITALHLVRGTPFAGCNTRRWWQWIAIPQEEMIAAVMDAADELGNRALQTRNAPLARYAARIEQAVDPLNEAGWRIELRAALQDGDIAGFHAVLHDLYARVGGKDPDYDVDEDTQILIDQASQRIRA